MRIVGPSAGASILVRLRLAATAVALCAALFTSSTVFAESDSNLRGTLFESGIASTYGTGDGFQGNLTACGQVFDTFVPQVAHKTLPCGTKVRVEDVDTGKSVVVEVTDRGPYIPGRIVDLSWAAYRELDPVGPGLRDVQVYLLPDDVVATGQVVEAAVAASDLAFKPLMLPVEAGVGGHVNDCSTSEHLAL